MKTAPTQQASEAAAVTAERARLTDARTEIADLTAAIAIEQARAYPGALRLRDLAYGLTLGLIDKANLELVAAQAAMTTAQKELARVRRRLGALEGEIPHIEQAITAAIAVADTDRRRAWALKHHPAIAAELDAAAALAEQARGFGASQGMRDALQRKAVAERRLAAAMMTAPAA